MCAESYLPSAKSSCPSRPPLQYDRSVVHRMTDFRWDCICTGCRGQASVRAGMSSKMGGAGGFFEEVEQRGLEPFKAAAEGLIGTIQNNSR